MLFEDYKRDVLADATRAIEYGDYDYCTTFEGVYDEMFIDDSITGNGSGSYTFCTYTARENVKDLIWDEDFLDRLHEYDMTLESIMKDGPEAIDVIARCIALGDVYSDIEDVWKDHDAELNA